METAVTLLVLSQLDPGGVHCPKVIFVSGISCNSASACGLRNPEDMCIGPIGDRTWRSMECRTTFWIFARILSCVEGGHSTYLQLWINNFCPGLIQVCETKVEKTL